MDLWKEINTLCTLAERAITELKERGKVYAKAEHDYRVALSKRLTTLRAEGQAVTHLVDIAKGEEVIARLRMERDIAESLYKTAQEAINVYKVKIRVLENQLSREWGAKNG